MFSLFGDVLCYFGQKIKRGENLEIPLGAASQIRAGRARKGPAMVRQRIADFGLQISDLLRRSPSFLTMFGSSCGGGKDSGQFAAFA